MADTIDDAQSVNELHQEVSLHNFKETLDPKLQPNYDEWDGENCVDCGEGIPAQRVLMLRCRCVSCQEDLEKRIRLSKHNAKIEEVAS
jgi:RNA polymerase-binding transcription factor DksA